MPDMILTNAIAARNVIRGHIQTAWGIAKVKLGHAFSEGNTSLPEAVISLPRVPSSFNAARSAEETYVFAISLRRKLVANTDVDAARVGDAQSLAALLLATDWNAVDCYLPTIAEVDMPEADINDGYSDLTVVFTLLSSRSQ